ncbi:hypothetical protein GDO86_001719 [Hymenochirus boettgeri]|uniref:Coiled-coil domain-containing protein 157 n=1 Tax=Hymenochirus boettgeri TaxID=247094 RepID=A0A8T2KJH7_9PIPI|nr:hypothetical protein GDO86_001719 [Hymenochirus boettgeri]
MAYMLGDRTCMDSLRKDITDLQGTMIDVFSRVGAVRYPSWKFPDKLSCDLDLVDLLERYDHIEGDPEFTQHSHVVLLELIIDRLLLLLQSFTEYTELIIRDSGLPKSFGLGPSMSIGLAVRNSWSKLLKLGTAYQKCISRPQSSYLISQHGSVIPSMTDSQYHMAKHTRTVYSQTVESFLVPCDACAIAQSSLREVSDTIIDVCNRQNLPCSLTKVRDMLPLGRTLSPAEMRYWANEESKDLARINKHLCELMQTICPLKKQLEVAKTENEKLQRGVESCRTQMQEQRGEQQRQSEKMERKLKENMQESKKAADMLKKDKEDLKKETVVLEEKISQLKKELKEQHTTSGENLDGSKKKILDILDKVRKGEMSMLEQKVSDLKNHLESTIKQLQDSEEALSKEKAHVESLQNNKDSLQIKQRSLLQQLDRVAHENEELQGSLGEAEDEKAKLLHQYEKIEEEKKKLKCQLGEQLEVVKVLQREKQSLEESISGMDKQLSDLQQTLQKQREREKLLVSYPELNPPPEFESTGDLTEDMEKQLQANSLRITILEEENSRLRISLSKLREKSHQGPLRTVSQTQLWSLLHDTESATLETQHQPINKKKPSLQLGSRGTLQSSASSLNEKRVSTGSTHQALNVLTLPAENLSLSAVARAKQAKGRNRTPNLDRK